MKPSFERIPASLSQEPIKVPGSPFWNVFKRFGRDEAIAMLVNVAGTVIMSFLTADAFILSLTGPVVEKFGFFPGHFREALGVYRTTPKAERKPVCFYFRKAVKGGTKSLLEDVLVHDPFYVALMLIGLKLYSNTPVWLMAFASFLIAVLIVAFGEVMVTELSYWDFKRRLKKKGFGFEKYYESRFLISAKENPARALKMVAEAFDLAEERGWSYTDAYFENKLAEYSGRVPRIRLRERVSGDDRIRTAQVVYTKAYEMGREKIDQYRYFPISKEKIYFMLEQEMPESVDEIKNNAARVFLKKTIETAEPRAVKFERILARSPDLLVSVDKVHGKAPFFLLELKTHRHVKLLKQAMRFVMQELPVIHTTQGKKEILFRASMTSS